MQSRKQWILFVSLVVMASWADAATVEMRLRNNVFVPNAVTINVGDTVRFLNEQGFHDVVADDGSFSRPAASGAWTFERTFTQAGVVPVFCSVHSTAGTPINAGMNARITIAGGTPFAINQGVAGAWFNPATSGQGFLFDVEPVSRLMFVAWFTFQTSPPTNVIKLGAPEHRWLTIQGFYSGATAPLTVFQTTGGVFNNGQAVTNTQVGTATITFTSCTNATVNFTLTNPPLSGTIPIVKLLPGSDALCRSLSAAEAELAR